MSVFAARIGRVRMKNGGADVRVLNRVPVNANGEDWRGQIIANARAAAEYATDANPLSGYIVIALFGSGSTSVSYRYDPALCPIPRSLFPAWVAEIIRRDLITEPEACHVVNRANGYEPDAS